MNHIATNLITKGLLNMSNITKGLISFTYEIVFKKNGGSGVPLHYNRESLYHEIKQHKEDDIELIKVYISSSSSSKNFKKIDVQFLKKSIEVELLQETNKKINVQIIE